MNVPSRYNVTIRGDGPSTLVFSHGFGCDQGAWRLVAPAFERSHRIVLFDHAGCGASDPDAYTSAEHDSLRGYARDVLELLRGLGLGQVTLVGHSAGAIIGALAAIEAPQLFERLVLLAASPRYLNDPPAYHGGFERKDVEHLLELMDQNFIGWATTLSNVAAHDPDVAKELRAGLCSTDPRAVREFAKAIFLSDYREELRRLTVPALVIQCTDDDIVPVSVGEYMKEHVPRCTYRLLQSSGHLPHLSHALETVALLEEYLALPALAS